MKVWVGFHLLFLVGDKVAEIIGSIIEVKKVGSKILIIAVEADIFTLIEVDIIHSTSDILKRVSDEEYIYSIMKNRLKELGDVNEKR